MYTRYTMTSRTKKLDLLEALAKKRASLIKDMHHTEEYAVGSVSKVTRKCGKKSCKCATGDGHVQTLFLFKGPNGTRVCKLVRRDDEEKMLSAGENYRRFKANIRTLKEIDAQIIGILVELMEAQAIDYE